MKARPLPEKLRPRLTIPAEYGFFLEKMLYFS